MNDVSWAPVFRAYGHNNRTLMLRLPVNRRCIEVRVTDSAANIYLSATLTVAAGLDGIRRNLKPGDPVNINTYQATPAQLAEAEIERLPSTLGEAIDDYARSDFARGSAWLQRSGTLLVPFARRDELAKTYLPGDALRAGPIDRGCSAPGIDLQTTAANGFRRQATSTAHPARGIPPRPRMLSPVGSQAVQQIRASATASTDVSSVTSRYNVKSRDADRSRRGPWKRIRATATLSVPFT